MMAVNSRLHPLARLRWAALLAIFVLLISPAATFAAPAAQDVDPALVGTWESAVSQAGETVTISLFADGTVSGISTYEDNDSQIIYGGTWESTSEDTFVLYVETVDGQATGEPVEFVGLVTRRGLRLPDAPDWGRNGMSLTLADENPTDFSAVAEEVTEEEPVAEATPAASEEVDATLAGVYASAEISDGAGGITIITITLYDDGSMETVTTLESTTSSDTSFETGFWVAEDDGTVTVTYETANGEPYTPPVPLNFLVDGDILSAPNLTAFGEDGLVVWRIEDAPSASEEEEVVDEPEITETEVVTGTEGLEDEPIAGLYVSSPIVTGDGVINGIMIYLGEDGFAQSIVLSFTGEEVPISRAGEWFDNGDGTVTISFDVDLLFDSEAETVESVEMGTAESLDFEVAAGMLINPDLTFYSAGQVITIGGADDVGVGEEVLEEEAAAEEASAEESAEEEIAGSGDSVIFISPMDTVMAGTNASLLLLDDGTASLAITSNALDATVVELGTWEVDEENGILTVVLALDGFGQPLEEPITIVFIYDEATDTLIPDDYDTSHYGPDLTLERAGN